MRIRRSLLVAGLCLLMAPSASLAASAGDNQYTDPFGPRSHKHHAHKGHRAKHKGKHRRTTHHRKHSSHRHR